MKKLLALLITLALVSLSFSLQIFAAGTAASAVKIALVGDENAQGSADNAYVGIAPFLRTALGTDGYEVKEFGWHGQNSTSFLSSAFYSASQSYKPDVVIVSLGVNDAQTTDIKGNIDTWFANMKTIIKAYKDIGAKVIALTPNNTQLPLTDLGYNWIENTSELYSYMMANADKLGADAIVDLYDASTDNALYLCFVNETACTAVASELKEIIIDDFGFGPKGTAVAANKLMVAVVGDEMAWQSGDGVYIGITTSLQSQLSSDYYVRGWGVHGMKSVDFANSNEYAESARFNPDVVVLCLGNNDANAIDVNAAWDAYKTAVSELIDGYHAMGAKVVVVTPINNLMDVSSAGINWSSNGKVFADKIKAGQEELGYDYIVDGYSLSEDNQLFLCYLNDTGCAAIASAVKAGIDSFDLEVPATGDTTLSFFAIALVGIATVVAVRKIKR